MRMALAAAFLTSMSVLRQALLLPLCCKSGHHTLKVLPELEVALAIAEAALHVEALRHLAVQRVECAEEVGLGVRQQAMFGCSVGRSFN